MPSYMLRGLPAGLIQRAKARARSDDTTLDAILIRLLTTYADSGLPGQAGGRAGGQARAEKLSPERRSEIARQAALTRHHRS